MLAKTKVRMKDNTPMVIVRDRKQVKAGAGRGHKLGGNSSDRYPRDWNRGGDCPSCRIGGYG